MKTPSRFMQGIIVFVLLAYFGLAMFGKSFWPSLSIEDSLIQTLINLTIAGVMYYIGTTSASATKDDTIAKQLTPSPPTDASGTPVVKVDDSTPVAVEVKP